MAAEQKTGQRGLAAAALPGDGDDLRFVLFDRESGAVHSHGVAGGIKKSAAENFADVLQFE